MRVLVQTEHGRFRFRRDSQTVGDFFSHQQARVRGDGGVHGSRHGGVDLDDGLFEHGDVVEAAQDWVAEYTEHDGAQETADAVDAKDVQRVVVTKVFLHRGGEKAADDTGGDAA